MLKNGAQEFGATTVVIGCNDERLTEPILGLLGRLEVKLHGCSLILLEGGVYDLLRGEKAIVDDFRETLALTIGSSCERIILIGHADCRRLEINGFAGEAGIEAQETWLHHAKQMIDEDPEIKLPKTVSWRLFMAHLAINATVVMRELRA